jgi:hypothetical protein
LDNGATNRHVGVHITNVVDEGFSLKGGDEGTDDTFEWRIGHGQNYVTREKQCAGDREQDEGEIIENSFFHLQAGIVSRSNANDFDAGRFFRLEKPPTPARSGIVGRPATENGDIMARGESIDDGLSHFCGGGSIGRKVKIQEENTHAPSVQG